MQDDSIKIGNEFTVVHVRKVYTGNGERLEIDAPQLGFRIQLDALELESLTWQTTETFSRFLETPFGPRQMRVRPLSDAIFFQEEED